MKWNRRTILILVLLAFLTGFFGAFIIDLVYNEDDKFTVKKWEDGTESGWLKIDPETEEAITGDRWVDGKHQVWVQVPGEGLRGGHWDNDLDYDGVPASVDDDDNDPEVGDEDPNNP
ncbi:MAG: hypothetical protein PVF58_06115 [Candidatus Methanofastidiosia archaeon]